MSGRAIAGVAAVVVGLITVGLSTHCDAGGELVVGSALTGVLGAIWNDNPDRGIGARITKFLLLIFMVGLSVFVFTLIMYGSRRCS
jgi:hypothetical protein